jgi:peptidoglycan/xylan/chitin deacetylase (PgdA/CDA1 family)
MTRGQRTKNAIKQGIRLGIGATAPFLYSARHPTSRILTYHSIGYRKYEMNVTPEAFAAQMDWLATHKDVISLEAAADGQSGVAITFDDGYADNLENAVPVLEKYGFPATIFVVSGHLDQTLPEECEPETGRLLSEKELRESARRGLEIGAHTVNHPHLSLLSPDEQAAEIAGSKAHLEEILGQPVPAFAYPYGSALDYGPETKLLVAQAGFSFACSNQYGHNTPPADCWALRRIWIDSTDTISSFQDKVSGRLDALAIQDSAMGITFRRWLNRRLGVS